MKSKTSERDLFFVGLLKLGTVDPPLPPGQDAVVARVLIGPPGETPSGIPLDGLSADYESADAYLNAQGWHADADKIAAYEAASPFMRNLSAKCAETQVVSAIEIVGFYGSGSSVPAMMDGTSERRLVLLAALPHVDAIDARATRGDLPRFVAQEVAYCAAKRPCPTSVNRVRRAA